MAVRTSLLTYLPGRTTDLGFVPSLYSALLQPSFGQGSRGYQFNDLTTKSMQALYCISKRVYPRIKHRGSLDATEARSALIQKKNCFVFWFNHYPRPPFLCPVQIRELTVCAAWYDNRDRVVRWLAGERT